MAFAAMMLGILAIFAIIIFFQVIVVGIPLLIIGLINLKKQKNQGKKWPKNCAIIGTVLILTPVFLFLLLITLTAGSKIQTGLTRLYCDNVVEKWRFKEVSDVEAENAVIHALLEAADENDVETFKQLFTPYVYNIESFGTNLEAFFESYPEGLFECELNGGLVDSDISYKNDRSVKTASAYYTCYLDDEWYSITLDFCYGYTDSPDHIGVTFFSIENLEGFALRSAEEKELSKNEYLICNVVNDSDVSARLIGGKAYLFTPMPERTLTLDKAKQILLQTNSMHEVEALIGKPNAIHDVGFGTGSCFYELESENGEPLYLIITKTLNSRILYATVCNDTKNMNESITVKE